MPEVPYNILLPKVGQLLRDGAKLEAVSVARWKYNAAGRCQSPLTILQEGRPYRHEPGGKILVLETEARCRKCSDCLEARRREWTRRAVVECERSARTWFGTLTLRPGEHALARFRAAHHLNKLDVTFNDLTNVIGRDITKMFKRVRFSSKAKLRYMLVSEAHKNGAPHFHMLLHEQGMVQVPKRMLEANWQLGFSTWRLADKGTARYVCKYLAKEAASRVRASRFYGSTNVENAI